MKLENLKRDFPKMPEELRVMIEKEVQKQVGTAKKIERKNRIMMKKSFVAVLAAAMLLGTTVFAGVIYQIRSEAVGEYGVKVKVKELEEETNSSIEQTQEFSDVRMEVSYLPEGMVKTEEGKYSYSDALYQGGVSICFYKMDTKDIQFDLLVKNVIKNESIQVGDQDGVYLELQGNKDGTLSFNQRIYVVYPNFHYIMEMYVGSNVSKQEALKIAEGIQLLEDTSKTGEGIIQAYSWSDYLASQKEEVVLLEENKWQDRAILKNTHKIGEAFLADPTEEEEYQSDLKQVEIKVTDVQISDQIGLLDLSLLDKDEREEIEKEVDATGKLLPTKVNYIKYGDGINTLDKIVDSREVGQKLVYATVEYTNIGDQELSELLFMGELVRIIEEGNQVKMYYGEEPQIDSTWDVAQINSIANNREMWYYDVHGGERGNNYITNLKPKETVTVHMAWIVSEEELNYLYLSFDTYGGYDFTEHSLAIGYVDIRQ